MKLLITSSLPYCNSTAHLGNLIGSTLSGDIYARFKRAQGHDVVYLCGTDEYGSTTMIKAQSEGITNQQLCDKYHVLHKQVYDWFNIQFDVWGRTSTQMQTAITHEIFLALYRNGYIDGKTVTQFYCQNCKMFLADRYIKGTCYHSECLETKSVANGDQCDTCQKLIDVTKLIDPFCANCKTHPIARESEHLFLRLDKLAVMVEKYVEENNFKPGIAAIARGWLKMGLTPRCITRDLTWGTPVPKGVDAFLDRFANKVFYVWFDAPIGYYSILANARRDWREFLQPDTKWVSTQAKDNIPFHTVFFPATILGSGLKYPLINQICGTDYLLYEGAKFSKSNGVGIFGDDAMRISHALNINEDYWRFYLTKIRPESTDSNFSLSEFVTCIKTDLNNNIGNFINRCVALTRKYCALGTMCCYNKQDYDIHTTNMDPFRYYVYIELMDNFKFRDALKICLDLSNGGNAFLQAQQPWVTAKTDIAAAISAIARANMICWLLIQMLMPFIPATCARLNAAIQCNIHNLREILEGRPVHIRYLDNYQVPFHAVELDEIKALVNK